MKKLNYMILGFIPFLFLPSCFHSTREKDTSIHKDEKCLVKDANQKEILELGNKGVIKEQKDGKILYIWTVDFKTKVEEVSLVKEDFLFYDNSEGNYPMVTTYTSDSLENREKNGYDDIEEGFKGTSSYSFCFSIADSQRKIKMPTRMVFADKEFTENNRILTK